MTLNPFANEWVPPSIAAPNAKTAKSLPMAIKPTSKPRPVISVDITTFAGVVEYPASASPAKMTNQSSVDLQFDDAFDQQENEDPQAATDLSIHSIPEEVISAEAEAVIQQAQAELERDGPVQSSSVTSGSPRKVGPVDFEVLRVVGQGAFGKVFQVKHKGTAEVYAMKVMKKHRILEKDHSEYVKAERDVLTAIVHPFIVTLRFSFQTPSKLYLVLDFINGGHLFFNLYRQGVFSENVACLYTAEIVSAISYLHSRGIVHRDLKPENVLLDSDGHIRLTDFGLAKPNMENAEARTNSFIGTMEYMAPEIVEGKGHGKAVDWWSTGILLYEMLCGMPPFRAKSRQQLQTQIMGAKPKYPKFLSSDALSLLKGLLVRDPTKRLGSGPAGDSAIKKHAFFKTINWNKLEKREVEPTFKPCVKSSLSVENFDKIWTDQPAEDSPCNTPTGSNFEEAFAGFSYVAPSFFTAQASKAAVA